jgi:Flp pilus assembly protein TadG
MMRSTLCFLRDERGSQSIEFVLWVPIFVGLLVIVIDASSLYITQTEMENVARDTARRIVKGLPPNLAENHARNSMSLRDLPYLVEATFDQDTGAEVVITIETGTVSILGYLTPLSINGATLGARVFMRYDPTVNYGGA